MEQNPFTPILEKEHISRIALILAVSISIVLSIAAWGKFFYPASGLKIFDRWISILEIFIVVLLLTLRKKWLLWLSAAALFASWGGYAFFWRYLELPCSCMGELIQIPALGSIFLDLLFFCSSLVMAALLRARRNYLYLTILSGCFLSLAGYACAEWIYNAYILEAKLS